MHKQQSPKVYVTVVAKFNTDGKLIPLSVEWEDGRVFVVDKVLDIRRAASLKAGGSGIRYTVMICRKETYLFLEEDRWFVERRSF